MGIRIEQINVERAGPISDLRLALQQFNLIYGLNEQGKTFLVEFVIQSLFNNTAEWDLRSKDMRGKVMVSGLSDAAVTFRPSTKHKLEHYLMEEEPGMPARINRLLVVKGAELSFEKDHRYGVNEGFLKQFLSAQGVVDSIKRNISSTVQQSQIERDIITGPKRGEIKSRKVLRDTLDNFDKLFEQVETLFSGGERRALQARIEELEESLTNQQAAKRHQAYLIHQRIRQHEEKLERMPGEELDDLKETFFQLQESNKRIQRQKTKLAGSEQESKHYGWLDEAIPVYEQRGAKSSDEPSPVYQISIGIALLLAIASSFLGYPAGTVILVVVAGILGWLYLRQYRSALKQAVDIEEMSRLEEEYQRRFHQPLSGLPQLKETKKSMEQAFFSSNTLREELSEEREKREKLWDQVASALSKLVDDEPDSSEWESIINELIERRELYRQLIGQNRVELAELGIAKSEQWADPAAVDYDEDSIKTLRITLEEAEEEFKIKTDELYNLKQRISGLTGDDISVEWKVLIKNLQQSREEYSVNYRKITAEILAGILVHEQLQEVSAQEEAKIREKLESPMVITPIHNVTKRYTGIRYEDEQLWVTDDFGRFSLDDLSTGALEQVLLGLRLGFAAQLFEQDSLFLILDDAFQHADWHRRKWLLDQMVALANHGWQIIYFTMDDHIKDLFDKAGHEHFPDTYVSRTLNSEAGSTRLTE